MPPDGRRRVGQKLPTRRPVGLGSGAQEARRRLSGESAHGYSCVFAPWGPSRMNRLSAKLSAGSSPSVGARPFYPRYVEDTTPWGRVRGDFGTSWARVRQQTLGAPPAPRRSGAACAHLGAAPLGCALLGCAPLARRSDCIHRSGGQDFADHRRVNNVDRACVFVGPSFPCHRASRHALDSARSPCLGLSSIAFCRFLRTMAAGERVPWVIEALPDAVSVRGVRRDW